MEVSRISSSRVEGYAAKAVGQPLEPFTYKPPKLREHDVRVSVTHCGVCHTDIQAIDDYYDITTSPFVPGHEIVGYVSAVGGVRRRAKSTMVCQQKIWRVGMLTRAPRSSPQTLTLL